MKKIIRQHYSPESEYATMGVIVMRLAVLLLLFLLYNIATAHSVQGQTYSASQGEIFIESPVQDPKPSTWATLTYN